MADPAKIANTHTEEPLPKHITALAMHGESQYNENSIHLSYTNPDAPKGGALKIASIGTFDTLNPYSLKGQSAQNIGLIYDRLMRRVWDEPFTMVPLIAQNVDVPNNRSSITFHLNPAARFHDNSPVTANDVLFSFETLKEHGRPNMRRIYRLVDKAEILDNHTILFTLGKTYDRETIMILALMPVLSESWWKERDFDATLLEPPLTNGPYRVKELDPGHAITYERVDNYWAKDLLANKGSYNFDTITYNYFRDDTIALEAFKKGDLDLRREWDVSKWQSAYNDMSKDMLRQSIQHQRPERTHGFIFNLRKKPFDDINVRKALCLAFDEDWISKNLFHGEFKRVMSFFPNSALAAVGTPNEEETVHLNKWREQIPEEVFEPVFKLFHPTGIKKQTMRDKLRKADKLLKTSGWIIENGKRVNNETKEPMHFEILLSSVQEEKIALTYKRTLKRLGIDIDIRIADSATFQKRKNVYEYDILTHYWQNSLSPGTEQMLYWSCDAAKKTAGFNYAGICSKAVDYYAAKIANAKSYDELTLYAHLIDRIGLSEYIFVPFFYKGVDYIAHRKTLHHPENTPIYGTVLESWWREADP
ncbi:MAG: ABC transporter substrate-binding protein [Alphaproteobacteria bacterium]|nr:ABC transporter substrate-binding protein [Alphaproteobacteria bacterium]